MLIASFVETQPRLEMLTDQVVYEAVAALFRGLDEPLLQGRSQAGRQRRAGQPLRPGQDLVLEAAANERRGTEEADGGVGETQDARRNRVLDRRRQP